MLRSFLSGLSGLLGGGHPAPAGPVVPLDPAVGPVYAVGDVHGCRGLLQDLLARIRDDAAAFAGTPQIVLLGDVIDRGPETARLVDDMLRPPPWARLTAIRGNHEQMMLAFIDDPHRNANWLAQGGFETLRSYGLPLDPRDLPGLSRRRIVQMIAAHLPDEHLRWLAALPWAHSLALDGQAWILAHAGYDGTRAATDQRAQDLVWGARLPQQGDGLRLVHGHVIRPEVDLAAASVGIDTGAYATGRLTALRLAPRAAPALLAVTRPS